MTIPLLEWPRRFDEIRQDLGYEEAADQRVTADLARRLAGPAYAVDRVWSLAGEKIRGRRVNVVGAADTALHQLARVRDGEVILAADGATTAVLESNRRPTLILTDLDGNLEDQRAAVRAGSLVFVHAHGDNGARIDAELSLFEPARVAGTCQTPPVGTLRNVGGFTDGDRAVFFALALGAAGVRLLGFDYDHGPGRYTGRFNPATKAKKLAWAKRLIDELIASGAPVAYA